MPFTPLLPANAGQRFFRQRSRIHFVQRESRMGMPNPASLGLSGKYRVMFYADAPQPAPVRLVGGQNTTCNRTSIASMRHGPTSNVSLKTLPAKSAAGRLLLPVRVKKPLCWKSCSRNFARCPAPKQTDSNPQPLPVGRYAGHIL